MSRIVLFLTLIVATGCLDPYYPYIDSTDVNILVVDGALDTGDGSASVVLSRGVSLALPDSFPRISMAFVAIEDVQGNVYPLAETSRGRYQTTGIPINPSSQYRLHVVTPEDDEYYSDPVTPMYTPSIDSVTWVTNDNVLTIRANTHDNTNQVKYYRWTFEETWYYHAAQVSQYKVVGKTVVPRNFDEIYFYCYKTEVSSNIIVGTTERLSQNIISQMPIQTITAGSKRLQSKYSIQVSQRAISQQEYDYLQELKKTTESIGGLFDPQPAPVTGNIRRVRAGAPLGMGYFGAGNITKQRIFITASEVPRQFAAIPLQLGCMQPDTVCMVPRMYVCVAGGTDLTEAYTLGISLDQGAGYTITSPVCADCRTEGGVTTKPDFWE